MLVPGIRIEFCGIAVYNGAGSFRIGLDVRMDLKLRTGSRKMKLIPNSINIPTVEEPPGPTYDANK